MPPKDQTLISIFENNELKISILYRLYAKKMPKFRLFWNKLADEEVIHAQKIASINIAELKESFQETKFSRGIISYIDDFVEKQINQAKRGKVSHIEALNVSLRIEQSLLEKKCFEIFIPTNKKVKEVMQKLEKDTERHEKLLRKELEKQ